MFGPIRGHYSRDAMKWRILCSNTWQQKRQKKQVGTRYAWDSVRFFFWGGKQIEYYWFKWWINYSIMGFICFADKNGTNCMSMSVELCCFLLVLDSWWNLGPWWKIIDDSRRPQDSQDVYFCFVCCYVQLLEWRWWKGASLFWRRMKYICAGV